MKNIFKKIAVVTLAVLMCLGSITPIASAAENKCPGTGKPHSVANCSYTVLDQVAPTCNADGFVTGRCTACNVTFAASSTAALGHNWGDVVVNCNEGGTKTCKRCGITTTVF